MKSIDDPMLALILRFIGRSQEITFRDDEFLQDQLRAIGRHIEGFPPEERQARAFEWVEKHARDYRDRWAQGVVDEVFSGQRCPDCPLAGTDLAENCQIHERWLELLHRYIADEISTRTYTEDSLALLARHKEDLRVNPTRVQEGA